MTKAQERLVKLTARRIYTMIHKLEPLMGESKLRWEMPEARQILENLRTLNKDAQYAAERRLAAAQARIMALQAEANVLFD